MKLTTHLHLAKRLRMHGVIPPLPQYIFMVWYLTKQCICLHVMVLSQAQGQPYFYLSILICLIIQEDFTVFSHLEEFIWCVLYSMLPSTCILNDAVIMPTFHFISLLPSLSHMNHNYYITAMSNKISV